jgi:hypothetical protein
MSETIAEHVRFAGGLSEIENALKEMKMPLTADAVNLGAERIKALAARCERLEAALRKVIEADDGVPELNMSNCDYDDVDKLNRASIELHSVIQEARVALASLEPTKGAE